MSKYLLLLRYADVEPHEVSPSRLQELVEQVRAWHDSIDVSGRILSSGKLKDGEGRTLRLGRGGLVVDGPYTETKEVLGGFFLIEAEDYDQAEEIAAGCPMLRFGGCVEIRALETMEEALP